MVSFRATAGLVAIGAANLLIAHFQQQNTSPKVEGLLVVSADVKLLKEVHKKFLYGMPFSALQEKFQSPRYLVTAWGKRSAIFLDREIGPIKKLEGDCLATEALLASFGKDGATLISELDPKAQSAVLDGIGEPGLHPDGFDIRSGAVAITASLEFKVIGPDGQSKPFEMPLINNLTNRQSAILKAHPVRSRAPKDREELDKLNAATIAKMEAQEKFSIETIAVARSTFPEAMRELSVLLDREFLGLRERRAKVCAQLLQKLGFTGKLLPSGEFGPNELAPELRELMSNGFGASWRGMGFGSQAEAEAFFNNGRLTVSTAFNYSTSMDEGGRAGATHRTNYRFALIEGGIAP